MAIALIVAAGSGARLGADGPKAFVGLAGRPMIAWSLDAFRESEVAFETCVAVPPGWQPATDGQREALEGVTVCAGGAERSHSVRNALAAVGARSPDEPVLVHDAARPLVTGTLIARMVGVIDGGDGPGCDCAVAAVPVSDTVRVADSARRVVGTPDRSTLWAMQTPQAFRFGVLQRALEQDEAVLAAATDDAALVEAIGGTIELVPSDPSNLKVTTAVDLDLAAIMLERRATSGEGTA